MKKIILVVVAAAALFGLGYSFLQMKLNGAPPSSASAAAGKGDLVDANGHANGEATSNESANLNPEKDGAQFQVSKGNANPDAASANPKLGSISFEGAELPQGDRVGRNKQALDAAKDNLSAGTDLKFAPLEDNTETVGKAYFPHGDMAKRRVVKAVPDHINDDLLIMEGRSEDRIVTAGSK